MNLGAIGVIAIVLSLLSIPFVTEHVTISAVDDYKYGLAPVLNESTENFDAGDAKRYPGTTGKTFGPKRFEYKTETAFGSFYLEIVNDDILQMKQTLINPDVKVEKIVKNNDTIEEKWILTTNEATLTITKSFDKVREEFSTAAGSCFKEEYFGNVEESCSGQMGKIQDRWDSAKDLLEKYIEKMNNATQEIELPNIQTDEWDY
ncbi:MAG: hypothetical protein B6U68_01835 [Candidatus Aenigmarchaeota archaeon ex4484_14]|nr:MAG: hypothetical protein B6U68_01835 [Candidatus Aenigmarchaeota archaeon ex4484_14]